MPLHRDEIPGALKTNQYAPAYLALVSNAMSWGTSTLLRESFGIGLNDWRVIAALAMRPGLTSGGLSQLLGLTKSVVSRSTTYLTEEGLIGSDESNGNRRLYLTEQGLDLYNRVLPAALQRQEMLLTGFTPEERTELMGYLLRMYRNLKPSTSLEESPSSGGEQFGAPGVPIGRLLIGSGDLEERRLAEPPGGE